MACYRGFIGRALPKLVIDRTTIPFMAVPDKDVNLSQRTKYIRGHKGALYRVRRKALWKWAISTGYMYVGRFDTFYAILVTEIPRYTESIVPDGSHPKTRPISFPVC